jgi:hypothetical protein
MEQDEAFLPYTTNPNLTVAPLPRSSLDGEIDTTNLAFTLTSRVSDKVRAKLAYRYDERDNKTTQDVWSRVIADSFLSGQLESNIPYSFERSVLNLSADYDLLDNIRISGGYDRKTIDRDFQEVAEQTEDSGWGRLRWRPNETLQVDIRGGASERDIDRYDESVAAKIQSRVSLPEFWRTNDYGFASGEPGRSDDQRFVCRRRVYAVAVGHHGRSESSADSGSELVSVRQRIAVPDGRLREH